MAQVGLKSQNAKVNRIQDMDLEDIEKQMKNVKDKGADLLSRASDSISEYVEDGTESVKTFISNAGEYVSDAETAVRNRIRQHPFQSILIGVGIGAAIGLVWKFARSRA